MKNFLHLVFCILFLAANVPAAPASGITVDKAVSAVEQHYGALKDLTARVVQKNHLRSLGKTQTFDGKLWIKKPGKLRLEFTNGQLIVVDGSTALFYSRKSEQVVKKKFTDFAEMNIPVAFLLGAGRIRDDFDVLQPKPDDPGLLELIPKKSGAAMTRLVLRSAADGAISMLTIHDRSGNETEIAFSDVREGVGVEDKLFRFKPPKGTEIIEQ